jgi:hypothetical protein
MNFIIAIGTASDVYDETFKKVDINDLLTNGKINSAPTGEILIRNFINKNCANGGTWSDFILNADKEWGTINGMAVCCLILGDTIAQIRAIPV